MYKYIVQESIIGILKILENSTKFVINSNIFQEHRKIKE